VGLIPQLCFRGNKATIEVYIQYTNSLIEVFEFL
jgi:hypothetical protein